VFDLFPILKERINQNAGTLSGGDSRCWSLAGASCPTPGSSCSTSPPSGSPP
jgi:branched-chain amino acid transport system ATP-binding protein